MAAKKAAVKEEPAKAAGTAVTNIRAEMQAEMENMGKRIQAGGGSWIRTTQDKQFQLPDGTKTPGPLNVVIVDFAAGNDFHDRPFKKGEEMPPACFSRGIEPASLVPSESSPDKQAETCTECPNNQWGSNGAGKACSNLRFLAVTRPDDDDEIYLIKVSPTGIKAFDAYVQTLKAQYQAIPIGVLTEIYFDPNLTYGSLRFRASEATNPNLEKHWGLRKVARERLLSEPDVSKYEPPKSSKRK